jgi:two-component system NtrC family response regulator
MAHILVIDDDPHFRDLLLEHCSLLGHEANGAASIEEGKAKLAAQPMDLVFLDVRLPDGNGLETLPYINSLPIPPEVIIVTGMADANGAELAITNGAWDYLQKPLGRQEIILHIRRALEYHEKKAQSGTRLSLKRDEIIGESKAIRACLDQVACCSGTDTGVLITGETGTGKELFARAIHANSPRAHGPFVVVDCASLPEQLVTSILFGHGKGAFTGADSDRQGLIEQACGGTLFLDEAGELPLDVQKNFLRVLQERVFRPVGKQREQKSDFRLIAATHRNLEDMVRMGQFRKDLYFRLNTFAIHLPPLRARDSDIEKLALSFVFSISRNHGLPIKGIVSETLETLQAYPWPGNVRELRNVLQQAILADPTNPVLYPVHLPPKIRLHRIRSMVAHKHGDQGFDQLQPPLIPAKASAILPYKEHRRLLLNDIEKQYLQRLLRETDGDIAAACAIAHFSRSHLYNLMKFHALTGCSSSCPEKAECPDNHDPNAS